MSQRLLPPNPHSEVAFFLCTKPATELNGINRSMETTTETNEMIKRFKWPNWPQLKNCLHCLTYRAKVYGQKLYQQMLSLLYICIQQQFACFQIPTSKMSIILIYSQRLFGILSMRSLNAYLDTGILMHFYFKYPSNNCTSEQPSIILLNTLYNARSQ